jgi:hypothetical protein
MYSLCRFAVAGMAALGLVTLPWVPRATQAAEDSFSTRRARSAQRVELEVPPGLKQMRIEGEHIASTPDQIECRGPVTVEMSNGVQLRTQQSRVAVARLRDRVSRIYVEPQPGDRVELEIPSGVNVGLVGGTVTFDQPSRTLWTEEPMTASLSNGIRLRTRQVRFTLVMAPPDGGRGSRILVEPLAGAPTRK